MDGTEPMQTPGVRPVWIPADLPIDRLPPELRQAAVEIVEPLYRDLVFGRADPLARPLGLSLAHLIWVELVGQARLGRALEKSLKAKGQAAFPQRALDRHLRAVGLQHRLGSLLAQIRSFQARYPDLALTTEETTNRSER